MNPGFAQVALPLPLPEPYTYRIPDALVDRVLPGARVVVPVRHRELIGIVTATGTAAPAREARDILAAPDEAPALPEALLRTADWIAGYYGAPIGLALRAMLPGGLWGQSRVIARLADGAPDVGGLAGQVLDRLRDKGGEAPVPVLARALKRPVWDALGRLARVGAVALRVEPPEAHRGGATERIASLTGQRPTLVQRDAMFKRAPRQRRLYEVLEELGGQAPVRHLTGRLGFTAPVLSALQKRGLMQFVAAERIR
ncbi:MAG: hypothetical protein AB7Q69_06040, partial [Gemmatimonadales bacterium]